MNINDVIIKPLLTEKATAQVSTNIYTFEVAFDTSKYQIAKAVEALFKVKVTDVKVNIRKGKTRRVGKKMNVKAVAARKIAYVRIKEGTINVFPKA